MRQNETALRPKTHSYLIDDSVEIKKEKGTLSLEATQTENNINQLEKKKVDVDSPRKNHKKFIKNNKLTLKSQQRFRNEKYSLFIEEIDKD